jgi:hypothetical protein
MPRLWDLSGFGSLGFQAFTSAENLDSPRASSAPLARELRQACTQKGSSKPTGGRFTRQGLVSNRRRCDWAGRGYGCPARWPLASCA